MPFYVWLVVLHPVPLTLIVLGLAAWLLARTGLWAKYKWVMLGGACALYAIDAAFALPRIAYSWRIPDHTVIERKIPLPKSLVLVHTGCQTPCQHLLASGQLDEVILIERDSNKPRDDHPPVRYRAGWGEPNACPRERRLGHGMISDELLRRGFCPLIEPAEVPADGIFVVQESFLVTANERAASFTSRYMTSTPPGKTIEFFAHEVQRRANGAIEIVASRRLYSAPGLIGLPPLIGCWARPDNIIWIMPPGDTGCGLWRWFTWGGDQQWSQRDASWVFENVFIAPDMPPKANQ